MQRHPPTSWTPPPPRLLEGPRAAAAFEAGEPVLWERVRLEVEPGRLGEVTLLITTPAASTVRRPAVLLLHSTGKCKEFLGEHLERYARRGFIAVAFDARYHGERALPHAGLPGVEPLSLSALGMATKQAIEQSSELRLPVYFEALVQAWRTGGEKPFLYDTVSDAFHVLDYLVSRPDVDSTRLGCAGVSLGGMEAWLLAAADTRVKVVVPSIGVQSFRHALDTGLWVARAETILPVFEAAARDMGKKDVDVEVVEAVWRRLVPGLANTSGQAFDAPLSLRCIAPRPMLVVNGELDPRCPIEGVRSSVRSASEEYKLQNASHALRLFIELGVGHEMTPKMWRETDVFLEAALMPRSKL